MTEQTASQKTQTEKNVVVITLTNEQREQIKKQTGKLINVLRITPQELEERANPVALPYIEQDN